MALFACLAYQKISQISFIQYYRQTLVKNSHFQSKNSYDDSGLIRKDTDQELKALNTGKKTYLKWYRQTIYNQAYSLKQYDYSARNKHTDYILPNQNRRFLYDGTADSYAQDTLNFLDYLGQHHIHPLHPYDFFLHFDKYLDLNSGDQMRLLAYLKKWHPVFYLKAWYVLYGFLKNDYGFLLLLIILIAVLGGNFAYELDRHHPTWRLLKTYGQSRHELFLQQCISQIALNLLAIFLPLSIFIIIVFIFGQGGSLQYPFWCITYNYQFSMFDQGKLLPLSQYFLSALPLILSLVVWVSSLNNFVGVVVKNKRLDNLLTMLFLLIGQMLPPNYLNIFSYFKIDRMVTGYFANLTESGNYYPNFASIILLLASLFLLFLSYGYLWLRDRKINGILKINLLD